MAMYLTLAIAPIFLSSFFPGLNQNKKQRKYYFILCGIAMLIVMGLRHNSLGSTDTQNYYNAMQRAVNSDSWSEYYRLDYYEIGMQFFVFVLSRIFHEPQWLLIATSLIYIVSIFYFIERNSDDIPLSLTAYISLGLMMFHLQGMRQSIAMCICLFAYEQAKRKHLVKFILLVLLAATFHQTAIVFFPIYFLVKMKYSAKNLLFMAAGSAIIVFFADSIIGVANNVFDRDYYTSVDSGGFVATSIYIILLIVSLFYYHHQQQNDESSSLLYVLILGTLCYIMRYIGTLAAERISFYFAFSQIALLPNAIKIVVEKDKPLMKLIIIVLAVALLAYRLNSSEFVPYKFFWQ